MRPGNGTERDTAMFTLEHFWSLILKEEARPSPRHSDDLFADCAILNRPPTRAIINWKNCRRGGGTDAAPPASACSFSGAA